MYESALAGVRVVELGSVIAGPYAGTLLGDFGAEVIHVEAPGQPDPLREWGQARHRGRTLWWSVQSRNKLSITLDLRSGEGRDLCRRLLATCDVLIENFRPGTLERWGLGPDELARELPRLIVARVSGYGQTGPLAPRPGFASAGEAAGGLRYINGFPGQAPPRMGISLGDSLAAMFAVQGVLMALYHRDVHGARGQVVDAAITESCLALLEGAVTEYAATGHVREPAGTRLDSVPASNVFRSRDGRWIVVAANTDALWRRLCAAMGRASLASEPGYRTHEERVASSDEIDALIAAWVAGRDAEEVDRVMSEAGVVVGPVNSVADVFSDPQFRARGMFVEVADPDLGSLVLPAPVPKLSSTPGAVRHPGRAVGADNERVYGELLGLSSSELRALRERGVI